MTIYLTDPEIINFVDGFKCRKQNRNQFLVDLLRVAKQCRDDMKDAIRTVESGPLQTVKREEETIESTQPDHSKIIEVIHQSLAEWKNRRNIENDI